MKTYLVIFCLGFLFLSCERKQELKIIDSPTVTVVKLESAIYCGDFEASKEFIDLEQTFSKAANGDKKSVEDTWYKFVKFVHSISHDNKFSNAFPFHRYQLVEKINGHFSEVKLFERNTNNEIQKITYKLALQNGSWKVISFDLKR
mgnify:CR=1 FL=1